MKTKTTKGTRAKFSVGQAVTTIRPTRTRPAGCRSIVAEPGTRWTVAEVVELTARKRRYRLTCFGCRKELPESALRAL